MNALRPAILSNFLNIILHSNKKQTLFSPQRYVFFYKKTNRIWNCETEA